MSNCEFCESPIRIENVAPLADPISVQTSSSVWERTGRLFARKETCVAGQFVMFVRFDEDFCAWRAEVILDGQTIFFAYVSDRLTAFDTCDAAVDNFTKLVPR